MTDKIIRCVFDEDPELVALLDHRASLEGATRSAMLRRFVRLGLFGQVIDPQAPLHRPGSMIMFGLFVPDPSAGENNPPA